jgi:hypothetical protein
MHWYVQLDENAVEREIAAFKSIIRCNSKVDGQSSPSKIYESARESVLYNYLAEALAPSAHCSLAISARRSWKIRSKTNLEDAFRTLRS